MQGGDNPPDSGHTISGVPTDPAHTGGGGGPAEPPPLDLQIPDLRIQREVARGGFGVVYEAQQTALNRNVAVKLIMAEVRDEKVRLRFERECLAMGLLSDHPHIITVFDAGFGPSGQPYILMDFMPGGSLADRVDREGALEWREVVAIGVKLASALETAHRAGVLHRDIKPENVLMNAYGEPELGDFGIARLQGGPETRTDTLTASIAHVAPELLAGDPPSVKTDLYALGSTLYVLLSGRSAFLRDTDESIVPALTRISSEPVPDLRLAGIPDAVAEVVERLMAKDPEQRIGSALELAQHLRSLQSGQGLPTTAIHVPDLPQGPRGSITGETGSPRDTTGEGLAPGAPTGGQPGSLPTGAVSQPPALAPSGPVSANDEAASAAASSAPTEGVAVSAGGEGTVAVTAPPAPPTAPVPEKRGRGPLIAGGVAAVAVLAVAAILLLGGADPEPQTTEVVATPTPAAEPTAPVAATPTPEPGDEAGAGDDAEGVALDVLSVAQQISEVRGLPLRDNFDARRVPTAAYGPLIREQADREAGGELETRGRILAALRLIPPDLDYPDTIRRLWEEQFHGFYDASAARIHVRADSTVLSALQRSVVASEMMQALLDQSFDLEALHDQAEELDADRALTALIKGDTFLSSTIWAERFLTSDEQEQRAADASAQPDLVARSVPIAVRGELVFPFVVGPEFVRALFAEGGVEALNAAYDDPPTTTEQVIHPEKYLAREPALPVEVTVEPGTDWSLLQRRTFGEYDLQQLFGELDFDLAESASAGWGGGELVGWTRGEENAVAVWLEFDTAEDGVEACAAVGAYYEATGGAAVGDGLYESGSDAMALRCAEASVRFAIAPDAELAAELLGQ
jgi:serine/threonine-protein kinase PknK